MEKFTMEIKLHHIGVSCVSNMVAGIARHLKDSDAKDKESAIYLNLQYYVNKLNLHCLNQFDKTGLYGISSFYWSLALTLNLILLIN